MKEDGSVYVLVCIGLLVYVSGLPSSSSYWFLSSSSLSKQQSSSDYSSISLSTAFSGNSSLTIEVPSMWLESYASRET